MKLQLDTLKLFCKKSEEVVEFGPSLSFFYGEMSAGKSTIAELVSYCLGGSLVRTPAISSEVVGVQLSATIGDVEILLERNLTTKSSVEVSWKTDGEFGRERIQTQAGDDPIIGEDIFSLSDFLMKLTGLPILKVRRKKRDPDSALWRVSFRDFFEFCYLDQRHLDSSLFLLEQPIRAEKSKDVLRFVLGFHSERLNDLVGQLAKLRQDQRVMREAAQQIGEFLAKYGFSSQEEIAAEIAELSVESEGLVQEIQLQSERQPGTTVDEEDRSLLRKLSSSIQSKDKSIVEIQTRSDEQHSLIAEFVGMKFKAARSNFASELLGRAEFEACPSCGTPSGKPENQDECALCKSQLSQAPGRLEFDTSVIERDLSDRIEDLKRSLSRLKRSFERQTRAAGELRIERSSIQARIDLDKRNVESEYMKRARHLEARHGAVRERIKFLSRAMEMPIEIENIRREADGLNVKILETQRDIEKEEARFEAGRQNISKLESNFQDILRAIHFPEISEQDLIRVNLRSWMPYVYPNGHEEQAWTFGDAGSGGKMVLFKMTFALALHLTAAQQGLPLPQLLIIDSTMKNITPDINPEIFENFYRELYRLLETELNEWQLVLIDQTFSPPANDLVGFKSRKLTTSDEKYPPLISYYRGH